MNPKKKYTKTFYKILKQNYVRSTIFKIPLKHNYLIKTDKTRKFIDLLILLHLSPAIF